MTNDMINEYSNIDFNNFTFAYFGRERLIRNSPKTRVACCCKNCQSDMLLF